MHICTKIQIGLKVGAYCTNFSTICIKAIEGEVFYRTFGIGEVLKICLCGYPSLDLTSGLVRTSSRVCHILLGISCVLPTFKKIYQIKNRAYLQQFGIIHLPNPDLTYIRNPKRETKLYLCHSTS